MPKTPDNPAAAARVKGVYRRDRHAGPAERLARGLPAEPGRKGRAPKAEVEEAATPPTLPPGLDSTEAAAWRRLAKDHPDQVLAAPVAAEAAARAQAAAAALRQAVKLLPDGVATVITGSAGSPVLHPIVRQLGRAEMAADRALRRVGVMAKAAAATKAKAVARRPRVPLVADSDEAVLRAVRRGDKFAVVIALGRLGRGVAGPTFAAGFAQARAAIEGRDAADWVAAAPAREPARHRPPPRCGGRS